MVGDVARFAWVPLAIEEPFPMVSTGVDVFVFTTDGHVDRVIVVGVEGSEPAKVRIDGFALDVFFG